MVLEGFCSSLYYELSTRDWTACPLRQLFELKTKSTDDQTTHGLLERAQGTQRSFGADPLLLAAAAGLFWLPTASAASEQKLSQFEETRVASPRGPKLQARIRLSPQPKSSRRATVVFSKWKVLDF